MRLHLFQLLLLAVLACPSQAGGTKPAKPEPGNIVPMPFLIAPMSKDGKLLGYAYISSKLECSSSNSTIAVSDKIAFIQDVNVRDVNAHSVARADDPLKVDEEALSLRLADNARQFVGGNKVVRIMLTQVQFAPLHPSESTLNMLTPQEKADAVSQAMAAKENPASTGQAQKPGATPAATSKPPAGPAH
jgi:hypothetical protein